MSNLIHYCWFGPNPISNLNEECISTWGDYVSNITIFKWSEENSPIDNPVVQQALRDKKWAFASDYVRLWAVYEYGGIYLDTDIELVKNIDHLFLLDCFLGYQDDKLITNGVFGAKKGSAFVKACMDRMENNHKLGKFEISPIVVSNVLQENTFDEDIEIFTQEVFYPYKPNRDTVMQLMYKNIKNTTLAIHHWQHSWKLSYYDRLKIISRKYFRLTINKLKW
ncbi:glycosyltransferase [Vibrio sp. 1159]|uniref:glycosyltransferase family 32 protein n=1 Tax=Vibrio sp. 1159 TaxID=3074545 RepID=UPI00296448DA|nr:glycosyltransferase [Vibrio sp. 1159]MDW2318789.1 glycosyltransferase [Vibrio sp. 1159]